ncbi:MAG: response regulator [Chloroflexi bacterium]|nr:response regulator [Chloroflexota bacterium]
METILVVDDTAEIRMLLVATLQQAGYSVVEASDGSGVMRWVEDVRPSAIILDLMMPGIDGWETLALLKSREDTKMIPVIISSALRGDEDLARARSMGAHDYVTKPWSAATLLERLRWALSGSAAA